MSKLPKNRVPVSIGIPFDLLQIVDKTAAEKNLSRSDYVVQLISKEFSNKTNNS